MNPARKMFLFIYDFLAKTDRVEENTFELAWANMQFQNAINLWGFIKKRFEMKLWIIYLLGYKNNINTKDYKLHSNHLKPDHDNILK